jgi:hypothetical protein
MSMFRPLRQAGASFSDHPRVVSAAFTGMGLLSGAMTVAANGSGTIGP